jgi:hypothetical protein
MNRTEMACATCHAPLNMLGDPPAYIHPLSFTTDRHQPVPVPAETLETIAGRCDFCGNPYPVWTLHGNQAISVLAVAGHGGGGLVQDYGHAWAACASCEQLAANKDVHALAARAGAAIGWKQNDQALRHIAQLHAAFLHRAPQRRSLVTTTAWPPGHMHPRELPKVRDRLARLYQGHDQLPGPYTGQVRTQLADGLLAARLYWIDPEFTTLAHHAAAHLPETTLDPDQLPADSGLLVWAQPVTHRQVAASSWTVDHATGAFQIACYRHIGTGLDGPALQRVREQIGRLVPTRLIQATPGQALPADGPAAPLVATWLLIAQQAVETLPAEVDRATRRAYQRQARPAPEVRIVRIRPRPGRRATGSDSAGGGVRGRGRGPLQQREWVGGHWKHQAHGPKRGQRRLIYVHPYIRGPQKRAAASGQHRAHTRQEHPPPQPHQQPRQQEGIARCRKCSSTCRKHRPAPGPDLGRRPRRSRPARSRRRPARRPAADRRGRPGGRPAHRRHPIPRPRRRHLRPPARDVRQPRREVAGTSTGCRPLPARLRRRPVWWSRLPAGPPV